MQISMDGRVALITGGSKGIGLAVARALAAAGASVAILARGAEALEAARSSLAGEGGSRSGVRVRAYPCDVARADAIRATFDEVVRDFGQVDILVNNAGTSRTAAFESITDEVWQEDLDLKLFAAIRLSRIAWPGMKERRWGRIINVLNTFAKAPRGGSAPTSVSRAGRHGADQGDGRGGGRAQHPGQRDARRPHRQRPMGPAPRGTAPGTPYEDFTRALAKDVPMGRVGRAEEFANLACFLASDAGSYITGTAINVDGGRSPVV